MQPHDNTKYIGSSIPESLPLSTSSVLSLSLLSYGPSPNKHTGCSISRNMAFTCRVGVGKQESEQISHITIARPVSNPNLKEIVWSFYFGLNCLCCGERCVRRVLETVSLQTLTSSVGTAMCLAFFLFSNSCHISCWYSSTTDSMWPRKES